MLNLRSTTFGLKIWEKFFPAFTHDEEIRHSVYQASIRFKECLNKKSWSRIQRDIKVCKQFWKCYPHQYFIQDLYREDCELSDDELCRFIPPFFWYKMFLPYHSNRAYSIIGENKIVIEHFFRSLAISHPPTLGVLLDGALYSADMERITLDQLQKTEAEKIFVKPVDAWGGKGIDVFHRSKNGEYVNRHSTRLPDRIRELADNRLNAIVQIGITQDPGISKLYPDSINTARIITENTSGTVRVVGSILRMGRGGAEIDNISSGGICTHIDSATGKTGDFALSEDQAFFSEHPDTHLPFCQFSVPRWDEIRQFAIRSAGKMPFLTYIGWDIALTPEGPVAIEINRLPTITIMETVSGGMRDNFRIDDPLFYWKHPVKK